MILRQSGVMTAALVERMAPEDRDEPARHVPEDGIYGEERGSTAGVSGRRWIIDPINGTASFTCRVTDLGGTSVLKGGMTVPATNGLLHEGILNPVEGLPRSRDLYALDEGV
ncbi:hypothetical protein [Streptomyces sp. NPDC058751]|uniref:hypothetical protein n=1 Tax=Streptomyces sp. NPDC058751 TaxID=3346623 RepID=UPI0036AE165B